MDPQRRSRYDSGSPLDTDDRRSSGFEGFDFSGRGADHAATFGDLFAEVFTTRGEQQPGAERGADLHHRARSPSTRRSTARSGRSPSRDARRAVYAPAPVLRA